MNVFFCITKIDLILTQIMTKINTIIAKTTSDASKFSAICRWFHYFYNAFFQKIAKST